MRVYLRVYLAGGINGLSDTECNDWRSSAKQLFAKAAGNFIICVDPMRRDYRGLENDVGIDKKIVEGDLADIRSCQVMISMMPRPSWGTAMETFWAYRQGVYVIAVVPTNIRVSPWVSFHSSEIVHTIECAVESAVKFGHDGHYLIV